MAKSKAKSRQAKSKSSARSRGKVTAKSPKSKSGRKPLEIKVTRSRSKKDAWESRAVFSSNTSGTMFRSIGVNTDPMEMPHPESAKTKRVKVPKNEPLLQKVVTYMRTFNHARALSALLTSPPVRSALPSIVEVEVRKEVQKFVKKPLSFPSPQIVATGDKTHRITESAWGHILAEFKKEMPVFYMTCMAAIAPKNKQDTINNPDSYENSNRGRLGMMMTIPLFTRRERKFQYLSSLIGGQLWRHGCRQRIFHELYRLGISQRRHGSMDAARWLEGETTKGNRIMKDKYQIMDEVEAMKNGVLPSAERYETSDDEGSSESEEDESEEEVEDSSDVDSEEDLLDESDDDSEDEPHEVKLGKGKSRGRSTKHQVVIEEGVVDDNWQGDDKRKKSTSEMVISEMVKIAEQMTEASEQMKTSMKRKRGGRSGEEIKMVAEDGSQIVVQVSKEELASGMPITVQSTAGEGVPVNINQVMMGGIPTQIVQQEVVTAEEVAPELMAAQLLQQILPNEIISHDVGTSQGVSHQVVSQEVVATEDVQQEVVTTEAAPQGGAEQQTVVMAQNIAPQDVVHQEVIHQEVVPQEIIPQEIIQQEVIQQEVMTEEVPQEDVITTEVVPTEMVPAEIITTDLGSGEMATVVVTTEVVTTEEGTTQVVMVADDNQSLIKRPADSEPDSDGKRKRKKTSPYSP